MLLEIRRRISWTDLLWLTGLSGQVEDGEGRRQGNGRKPAEAKVQRTAWIFCHSQYVEFSRIDIPRLEHGADAVCVERDVTLVSILCIVWKVYGWKNVAASGNSFSGCRIAEKCTST